MPVVYEEQKIDPLRRGKRVWRPMHGFTLCTPRSQTAIEHSERVPPRLCEIGNGPRSEPRIIGHQRHVLRAAGERRRKPRTNQPPAAGNMPFEPSRARPQIHDGRAAVATCRANVPTSITGSASGPGTRGSGNASPLSIPPVNTHAS